MSARRLNPSGSPSETAKDFLRKYGSQALGWAKTASTIHRGLRDRIFWRKVYGCILRSLQRGDPLPNPPRSLFGKVFVTASPVGPVYRVDGAAVRKKHPDGVGGWHRRAGYPFIKGDEVWIEKMVGGVKEERFMLAHEMVEILLMMVYRWKYQRAHDTANRYEKRLRNGETPSVVFGSYLKQHFPNAGARVLKKYLHDFVTAYRNYK